jgi:hypothetical protein
LRHGEEGLNLTEERAQGYYPAMRKSSDSVTEHQLAPSEASPALPLRDHVEFVRFKTREDMRKAMGIFLKATSGDICFTFREDFPENTCVTNTATVRALRAHGFDFEWLTENV